ncbi:hypothetical protein [Massilia glaciei]|uniref:Uncharacterized protein n=1 Tax=Massilia glaciei TaxID=1524097 RepID=A0A2U2HM67_9BURK|nr:hypothetical protein [Massilia glaciei]PWF48614.1 hypothetical protein C7C56_010960 [Massilia glaciei]
MDLLLLYVLTFPSTIQATLLGLALVLFCIRDKKSYQKTYRGNTVFCFVGKLKIVIDPRQAVSPIALFFDGKRYFATPFSASMSVENIKETRLNYSYSTSSTSGTHASDGTYIPPQTVTHKTATGGSHEVTVGKELVFSFNTVDPKGKDGVIKKRFAVKVKSAKQAEAARKLMVQLDALVKEKNQAMVKVAAGLKGVAA